MLTALYCAPQDLACLLLGAVTVLTRATLQSCLNVVVEPSDQDLRHGKNDSTLSQYLGQASLSTSPELRDPRSDQHSSSARPNQPPKPRLQRQVLPLNLPALPR